MKKRGPVSINTRFWQQVNITETCWLWTSALDKDGYGKIYTSRPDRKVLRAHRYSYEIHKGTIPDGMFICHSCDNPTCVNPDHLWVGTAQDNNRDAFAKGRRKIYSGDDHWTKKKTQVRDEFGRFHKLKST